MPARGQNQKFPADAVAVSTLPGGGPARIEEPGILRGRMGGAAHNTLRESASRRPELVLGCAAGARHSNHLIMAQGHGSAQNSCMCAGHCGTLSAAMGPRWLRRGLRVHTY